MAYAVVADFNEVVPDAEARLLAPAAGGGRNDARILDALEDASATADTYLAGRYSTPLTPVPRALRRAVIDLARESLSARPIDAVVAAADRQRAWLKDLSRGVATLGSGDDGGDPPPTPTGGGAQVREAAPTFDGQLDGFMPTFATGTGWRSGWG